MSAIGRRLPDPHCTGCGHAPHTPGECPDCPCVYSLAADLLAAACVVEVRARTAPACQPLADRLYAAANQTPPDPPEADPTREETHG